MQILYFAHKTGTVTSPLPLNILTNYTRRLQVLIKRHNKIPILQLFLLCSVLSCFSQDYSFINYDIKDGLAGSVVYDALQDKDGFMWFATENGLSRFDGKNFKTFTTKDGLSDNEILRLFLDSKGRVWIMPFRPSVCYYYKGKIHNGANDSLLAKIKFFNHAFDMAEDKWGNLFIAEEIAWHEILKDNTIKSMSKVKKAPICIFAVGRNASGEVELLCTENQMPSKPKSHFVFHTIKESIDSMNDTAHWPDIQTSLINEDYVIIPDNHSSHLSFYKDTGKILSTDLPQSTVSISSINKRTIIINTRAGILFFDPQKKIFSGPIFQSFSFTSAFQDKENNLWLTTEGSGVLMVPSFQFVNYSLSQNESSAEISALNIKADTAYIGGSGKEIWKININNLEFASQPSFFKSGKIISILFLKNELLVTSSTDSRPFITNNALTLKSVYIGKSGILYATHKNTILYKSPSNEEIIWNERSTCAVEKDSGFYIGTLNGLFYKSYEGSIVNIGKINTVFASRIVNLAVSDNGVLWVTTKGSGIAAYSNNKLLYHITEADGLTSDNCTSLYIDGDNIWLGTNKGLNRIQISGKENKITRYSTSDGLPSDVINAIVAKGEKVFVGTPKGLTYFEADKISQQSICDLQLTGIYVDNKYWVYDSSNFSLPHKNNDVRFEFSGISFKSGGEVTYQYRLLGLQPEWRTTADNQLNFPSLSSGKYSFQLKAINKYGVESPVKEVSFIIEKLFWEKTWFRIFAALSLASLIWVFFRYRISQIRLKEKEKTKLNQHIAELEQRTLRSQMNPHFIFNSLNSIQQYVIERDIRGANNFITDFSKLIRMTLDLSTHTFISMPDELEYINTYLKVEKRRLEDQFDYFINVDESLDLREIYLPPLLLQPYVENCIRHGIKYKKDQGIIKISIQKKDGGILISIEDNGIGREEAQKYKSKYHIQYQSKGMSINKDRIDILNSYNEKKIKIDIADLFDTNNEASGTRVDIYLTQDKI